MNIFLKKLTSLVIIFAIMVTSCPNVVFSYAHYYAQNTQSDLHSAYVKYAKSVTAQSSKSADVIYEAENAVLSGTGIGIVNDSSASGGKTVGEFSSSRSKLTFTVNVEIEGYYNIIVNSKGIGSDKINYLSVNGTRIGEFSSIIDVYSDYTLSHTYLNKGTNTITITKSWGYIYLDYIKIADDDLDIEAKYKVSKTLINPNATDSAKRLMSFFCDNYGKNVISGQTCDKGYNGSEFTAIQKATGKTPAILGMDLMDYTPCRVANGTTCNTVEYAQQFNDKGGIIEIYWHWNAPDMYLRTGTDDSGNPRWWQGFYTKNVNIDLAKIMNGQDQTGYNLLVADIDAIAVQLKRLQDSDVPVLFRPLHEASGGWFWWGAKGADAYKKLWKLMYTRLTDYHGLNNLIWVWNGQNASWYPGDEYCDMVSEDIYAGTHEYSPQSAKFLEISEYSDENKIVALSENGCLFDVDKALEAGTLWSWFCVWGGSFCANSNATISTQYSELSMWEKVYQHQNVITFDELPDLKSYPLDENELPEISGSPEVASINLTLTGMIGANVYYTIPEGYINDNYNIHAVFSSGNSQAVKVPLDTNKTAIFNGNTTYMFTLPVKSSNMNREYSVSLLITKSSDDEKVTNTPSTSFLLNDYIKSFGITSDTTKQTFANAMQTYGYYSQKMFNTTDEFPNIQSIDLSDVTYTTVQDYEAYIRPFMGTKKATLGSSSLYLDSGTGIRTYISDIDTSVNKSNLYMQYRVNGVTEKVKVVQDSSGRYYGEIPDVPADKLSSMYNITFYEGNSQITDTAVYGAYSYIYSTLKSSASTDLQNLVKALYKYSVATDNLLS
ncbi:MAG: glycosyl hydrolase [Ruminococcus sp.]|nr:glycosyl hydrolase [Ruminococcus sp.]